jgi:hypothetical protein
MAVISAIIPNSAFHIHDFFAYFLSVLTAYFLRSTLRLHIFFDYFISASSHPAPLF